MSLAASSSNVDPQECLEAKKRAKLEPRDGEENDVADHGIEERVRHGRMRRRDEETQSHRNEHENPRAHASLCGKGRALTLDMAAVLDRIGELIQDSCQVSPGFGLHAKDARQHERLMTRHTRG